MPLGVWLVSRNLAVRLSDFTSQNRMLLECGRLRDVDDQHR